MIFARNGSPRALSGAWSARLATLAALVALACLNDAEDAATTFEEMSADEVVYGVSHNMSRDGIREARLEADSMLMWRDSAHTWVMQMTLLVFDDRGGQRATITADRGRFDMTTNELMAVGNAVLSIPGQGREIRTEVLNFSQETDRVWSDVSVVMRGPRGSRHSPPLLHWRA